MLPATISASPAVMTSPDDDTAPLTRLAAHVSGIAGLVPLAETSVDVTIAPSAVPTAAESKLIEKANYLSAKLRELPVDALEAQQSVQRG